MKTFFCSAKVFHKYIEKNIEKNKKPHNPPETTTKQQALFYCLQPVGQIQKTIFLFNWHHLVVINILLCSAADASTYGKASSSR